jgi:transposase
MARFDLSDAECRIIQPLLPNKPRGVARTDDRRVLNGIFFILARLCLWSAMRSHEDVPARTEVVPRIQDRWLRWIATQ